jgi:hypothetical protein
MLNTNQNQTIEEKRDYVNNLIVNNNKKEIEDFLDKNGITLKDLINLKDILIFSIENNASYEMVKYIVEQYDNLNYSIDFKLLDMKAPLFSAIASNKFRIADLLIQNGADINYELNYLIILYYLDSNNFLNKNNLKYILNNGFNVKNIDSYLINNFSDDIIKLIFKYATYNKLFILRLLDLYKNKKPLSTKKLREIMDEENNKLKVENDFYMEAIDKEDYNKIGTLLHYDNDNNQEGENVGSLDIPNETNYQKLFSLFGTYDRNNHSGKKYDFVQKIKDRSLSFTIDDKTINTYTVANIDRIREDIKMLIKEGAKEKITDYVEEHCIEVKELNTSDFDLLIYAIENTPDNQNGLIMILYLIVFAKYHNFNYFIKDGDSFKTPLTAAVGNNKFLSAEFLIDNGAEIDYKFVDPENNNISYNCLNYYYDNNKLNKENLKYILTGEHTFPAVVDTPLIEKLINNNDNEMAEYLIIKVRSLINFNLYKTAIMNRNIDMVDKLYDIDPRGLESVKDIADILIDLGAEDDIVDTCLSKIRDPKLNLYLSEFLKDYCQYCY